MARLPQLATRLALHPRRRVLSSLDGRHQSVMTDASTDFEDLRHYVHGDNVKDIDWKATARTGSVLIRRTIATRLQTTMILIPTTTQLLAAASPQESLAEVALNVAGLVSCVALAQGDRVCLITYDEHGPHVSRPSGRETEIEHMLLVAEERCREVRSDGEVIEELCQFATMSMRVRGQAVVVLDDWQPTPELERALAQLAHRHDVIAITVHDLDLATQPVGGSYLDHATSRSLPSFLDDRALRAELTRDREQRRQRQDAAMAAAGIPHRHLQCTDDVIGALISISEEVAHATRHP